MNAHNNTSSVALRVGLAFVLSYAAVSSLFRPLDWIGYFPHFLFSVLPPQILLTGFSLLEIALSFWLLSGWYVKWAALLSAAMLAGIVVFNLGILEITFRDVGLMAASFALFYLNPQE